MAANSQIQMDGYPTTLTIQNIPLVKLQVKSITPPADDGGDPIDVTTMNNAAWRTNHPRSLKSSGTLTATVAYATEALDQVLGQINVNQQLTVTFPDTSTRMWWGYLRSFTPAAHTEGAQPTAELVCVVTNLNVDLVEEGPSYTEPTES